MKIDHIALYVHDLEGARQFFMRYFGAKSNGGYHNAKTDFRSYFLAFDDHTRLELMHRPQTMPAMRQAYDAGYAHISINVGSKEQVDALTSRLKADGYEVADGPRVTGDGYYESCIVGFEGNLIEITI